MWPLEVQLHAKFSKDRPRYWVVSACLDGGKITWRFYYIGRVLLGLRHWVVLLALAVLTGSK